MSEHQFLRTDQSAGDPTEDYQMLPPGIDLEEKPSKLTKFEILGGIIMLIVGGLVLVFFIYLLHEQDVSDIKRHSLPTIGHDAAMCQPGTWIFIPPGALVQSKPDENRDFWIGTFDTNTLAKVLETIKDTSTYDHRWFRIDTQGMTPFSDGTPTKGTTIWVREIDGILFVPCVPFPQSR